MPASRNNYDALSTEELFDEVPWPGTFVEVWDMRDADTMRRLSALCVELAERLMKKHYYERWHGSIYGSTDGSPIVDAMIGKG